jgi:hypothetical protein
MGTRVGSKTVLPQNPLLSESLLSLSLQDKLPEEPKRLVLSLDEGLYGCGLLTRLTQHTRCGVVRYARFRFLKMALTEPDLFKE